MTVYLPSQIHYFDGPASQVETGYGRSRMSLRASFPVSGDLGPNAKTWGTAREWSGSWSAVVVGNIPESGYRFLGFDIPGDGKVRVKVASPQGRVVDTLLSTIEESIFASQFETGGYITHPLVWVSRHGTLVLVREGSDLHLESLAASAPIADTVRFLTPEELVAGGVYLYGKSLHPRMYLGMSEGVFLWCHVLPHGLEYQIGPVSRCISLSSPGMAVRPVGYIHPSAAASVPLSPEGPTYGEHFSLRLVNMESLGGPYSPESLNDLRERYLKRSQCRVSLHSSFRRGSHSKRVIYPVTV